MQESAEVQGPKPAAAGGESNSKPPKAKKKPVEWTGTLPVVAIAKICHEANKALCEGLGDESQVSWDEAPAWQKQSAVNGVKFHASGDHSPQQGHLNWLAEKKDAGWVYGEVKDAKAKTHPCMVDYNQLPVPQRSKDTLFKSIVDAFKKHRLVGAA